MVLLGAPRRLAALDVARGLAVAGMILVNNPGPGGKPFAPLVHASWHGWTFADLVFPMFLFAVGASIALALDRHVDAGEASAPNPYARILRRTLILFGVGLFLTGAPYFELHNWRVTGVLQRIAVCYLLAALLFLHARWIQRALVVATLLIAYWAMLVWCPVPGFGPPDLSPEGNIVGYIDRALLGAHISGNLDGLFDHEGLLNTFPALATTLIGTLAGEWTLHASARRRRINGLAAAGALLTVAGLALDALLPINKALWTSSYVLLSGGIAILCYAALMLLTRGSFGRACAKPLEVIGANAFAAYTVATLLHIAIHYLRVPQAVGKGPRVDVFAFDALFASWMSPPIASLAYGSTVLLVCLTLTWLLYRRGLFIRA